MNLPPILTLLLLGHVLGDFYLQWDTMARKKATSPAWRWLHSGVYALCMAVVMFVGARVSWDWLFIVLGAGFAHLIIDAAKRFIPWKRFTVDQFLHIGSLTGLWWVLGGCIHTREHTFWQVESLSASLILVVLGLLWILKPIGVLIEQGDIWDFSKGKDDAAPDDSQKGAGKMIGYLERIIVFFLLMQGEIGATIAFAIAAKLAVRIPEIGKSEDSIKAKDLAEYFIIGTLLSMISVFAVAFILGLL